MMSAPIGVRLAGFITQVQPAAIAGAILCAARLSGKLNGEISEHGPDRHALPHAAVTLGARGDLEVHHLAADAHGFLRAAAERVDQARGLAARILDRLAGLDAERLRDLLEALLEALDAVVQHLLALVRRKLPHRVLRLDRGLDAGVDRLGVGLGHARGDLARVLVGDLEVLVGVDRLVREVVRVLGLQHGGVLCLRASRSARGFPC
jgi:ribosomal protein L16/L10AE